VDRRVRVATVGLRASNVVHFSEVGVERVTPRAVAGDWECDVLLDERLDTADALSPVALRRRIGPMRWAAVAYWAISVLVVAGVTTWLYGPHVFDAGRILNQPRYDWAQQVWFLAWPAYALKHGLNPFYSTWMNYPSGINLMENTSMPLLGIVFAPITWLVGPTITYSIVLRLGMITSACSAQWVAWRLGISRISSLFAGLLYAFSTIELVEANGHAFLTFLPLPPLIGYALYGAVTARFRPWRAGITTGLLFAAQALISLEVALMTAICCALGLAVAAALYPRSVTRRRIEALGVGLGCAVGSAAILLVVPMLSYFGRGHFWGPAHADLSIYRANLASLVVPGHYTWLSPIGRHLPNELPYLRENGAYLGIPVLIVLVAAAVRGWRLPLVRIGTVLLGALLVLSLGVRLNVTGASTGVPLPFALLSKLPFVDSLSPVRLFVFIGLLVALLCAWGLDRAIVWARPTVQHEPRRAWARSTRQSTRRHAWTRPAVVGAAVVAVALSLAPAHPYPSSSTNVPAWLDSAQGVDLVPPGSVVLFYPYPLLTDNQPMLFQAVDGFRYKIVGGQGIVETSRSDRHAIGPLWPYLLPAVFLRGSTGEFATPPHRTVFALPPLPKRDAATVREFRTFATVNGITAIVVNDARSIGAKLSIAYLTDAFGPPTLAAGGTIAVWPSASLPGTPSSPARQAAPERLPGRGVN
jgi:hypothetical protein